MKNVVEFPDAAAIEREASEWLIKLDGDTALSPNEKARLAAWVNRSPRHREALTELAGLWDNLNVLTDLAVPLDRPRAGLKRSFSNFSLPVRIAAGAVLVLGVGLVFGRLYFSDPLLGTNGFYATAVGEQETVALSDGSTMLLNTNTQIKVAYDDGFRDVHLLQGEAHFTVANDKNLPFRVFAGAGQVRAVGTAFSVYLRNDGVDVTVTEGTVALAAVSLGSNERQLQGQEKSPGQQIGEVPMIELGTLQAGQLASITSELDDQSNRFETVRNLMNIETQDMSQRLAWTEGVLAFSGQPLEQVVTELSRYTTVKIEFSDPEVKAIRIGGRFPVGETEAMFESLRTNFGLRVTHLSKDHVLVSAGID